MRGKRDLLKRQLQDEGVHLLGLQETRVGSHEELPDNTYWMWHSSCTDEGQFGMALWLHKAEPFLWLNDRPVHVSREHITITCATPRLIIADLSCPVFRCVLIAAHAPHVASGGNDEAVRAFWRHLQQQLAPFPSHLPVILMVDANAHVGSVESGVSEM